MKLKKALRTIAEHYGFEPQLCKLQEELGEAMSAASELMMVYSYQMDDGKAASLREREERLVCELADVYNVADQLVLLLGMEERFQWARFDGVSKTAVRILNEDKRHDEME